MNLYFKKKKKEEKYHDFFFFKMQRSAMLQGEKNSLFYNG